MIYCAFQDDLGVPDQHFCPGYSLLFPCFTTFMTENEALNNSNNVNKKMFNCMIVVLKDVQIWLSSEMMNSRAVEI